MEHVTRNCQLLPRLGRAARVARIVVHFFATHSKTNLAPVVQKVDNAIHRINHYPLDSASDFAITYPLDSD